MAYILGINISHNPSICLLKDNTPVLFHEEKVDLFNSKSDIICTGIKKLLDQTIYIDDIIFASYRRDPDKEFIDKELIDGYLNLLSKAGIYFNSIHYFPKQHHIYHACKGIYESGFKSAAIIIEDGAGAYMDHLPFHREIESIYHMKSIKNIHSVYKHYSSYYYNLQERGNYPLLPLSNFPNSLLKDKSDLIEYLISDKISIGQWFTETAIEMFRHYDPNQIMNLSKQSSKEFHNAEYINTINNTSYLDLYPAQARSLVNSFDIKNCADLAKQIQFESKELTCKLIEKAIYSTGENNIILSGGYFMNSINNKEYIKTFPNINFYIDPKAYDGGTSVGAAYYLYGLKNDTSYGRQP